MRFPISDQSQLWSYLAPFRRYDGLLVEKSPVRTHPSLINRPRSGWPLSNFGINEIFPETRMFGLSDGEEIVTLAFVDLIQYRSVTDRRTDGHSSSGYTSGNALVKSAIVAAWQQLSQAFLDRSIIEWRRRLENVVQCNGKHIEHVC